MAGDRPHSTRAGPKGGGDLTCQNDTTFSFDPSARLSYSKWLLCGRRFLIERFTDAH